MFGLKAVVGSIAVLAPWPAPNGWSAAAPAIDAAGYIDTFHTRSTMTYIDTPGVRIRRGITRTVASSIAGSRALATR